MKAKASSILYVASGLNAAAGIMIPLMEMIARAGVRPDTFVEMLEMNPFSQLGLIMMAYSALMFILGIMVDRRGA